MPMLENYGTGHQMAGFENDIFISYAHIDNETFREGEKGWIAKLHRALELRVAQLYGKQPRIWRDPKLQGNDAFADRLSHEVPKTALLVSVISPRYLRSDWCRRELQTFISASEQSGGLCVADRSRVFKVVKTPIPVEKQPSSLQQMLGYEFFMLDPVTGRPSELTPDDPEIQRQYWSRLDDLAYDICQMLELMEDTRPVTEPTRSVFLANTTADLQQEHDTLRRDLTLRGFRVLPKNPLPLTAAGLTTSVRDDLAGCDLSIHLVGKHFGIVPEGSTDSISKLQIELALDRSEDDTFTRMVWLPKDLEILDQRQITFIDALRTDPRLQGKSDFLECSLESLKTEIRARLEKPEPAPDPEPPLLAEGDDDELRRIYLVYDQRDEDAIMDLEDYLFDRGFEVLVPNFEGDEAQVRQDHQENLCDCDAVLLYYGAANQPWLRRKLREVQKSAAFGRKTPLLGTAIYVAPPECPRKNRLKTREALVIQGHPTFQPEPLEPFIDWLSQAIGQGRAQS